MLAYSSLPAPVYPSLLLHSTCRTLLLLRLQFAVNYIDHNPVAKLCHPAEEKLMPFGLHCGILVIISIANLS